MSKAQTVEWHEKSLQSMRAYYAERLAAFEREKARVEAFAAEIEKYNSQITRAKRIGKTSFDSERFKSDIELLSNEPQSKPATRKNESNLLQLTDDEMWAITWSIDDQIDGGHGNHPTVKEVIKVLRKLLKRANATWTPLPDSPKENE